MKHVNRSLMLEAREGCLCFALMDRYVRRTYTSISTCQRRQRCQNSYNGPHSISVNATCVSRSLCIIGKKNSITSKILNLCAVFYSNIYIINITITYKTKESRNNHFILEGLERLNCFLSVCNSSSMVFKREW